MADNHKECCKNPDNLIPEDTGKSDLFMMRCKVCRCRHFELNVDSIKLQMQGNAIN